MTIRTIHQDGLRSNPTIRATAEFMRLAALVRNPTLEEEPVPEHCDPWEILRRRREPVRVISTGPSYNELAHEVASWIGSRPEETREDLEDWIPGLIRLAASDLSRFSRMYAVWHLCASRLWQPKEHEERSVMIHRVASRTSDERRELNRARNTSDSYKESRWRLIGGRGSSISTRSEQEQELRDEYNAKVRERMRRSRAARKALMSLPEAAE